MILCKEFSEDLRPRRAVKPILSTLVLLLLLGFGGEAWARLGDTLDQLTVRYGTGTTAGQGILSFHKQNWIITVWLINGVSAAEKYQKSAGPTDDDIAALLSVNSQGHTWKVKPVEHSLVGTFIPTLDPMSKSWERDDGALAFTPGGLAYCLTVKSKPFLDAEAAQDAADKKSKQSSLQGF